MPRPIDEQSPYLETKETRESSIPTCEISTKLVRSVAEVLYDGATKVMQQELTKLGNGPSEPRPPPRPTFSSPIEKFREEEQKYSQKYDEYREEMSKFKDWQRGRERLNDLQSLQVTLTSSQKTITSSSIAALDQLEIPRNLVKVSVEAGDRYGRLGYSAEVHFDLKYPESSHYLIVGRDAQLVNGVAKTLDDRLKENRTSHSFVHRDRYTAVVGLFLTALVLWAGLRIIVIARIPGASAPVAQNFGTLFILLFLVCYVFVWSGTSSLLKWLFPYFTYAEDDQNSRRRVIKYVVSVVFGGLLIALLYDLIRPIFFS